MKTPTPTDLEKQIDEILDAHKTLVIHEYRFGEKLGNKTVTRKITTLLQTICLTAKPGERDWRKNPTLPLDTYKDGYNQALSDYETNLSNLIEGSRK